MVVGNGGGQIRVEHELVLEREFAVHSQLEVLGLVHHHTGTGCLGAGARERRYPDLVLSRPLDQISALVVLGPAAIAEQVGDCLGDIEAGTAAHADDRGGGVWRRLTGIPRDFVHAIGRRLISDIEVENEFRVRSPTAPDYVEILENVPTNNAMQPSSSRPNARSSGNWSTAPRPTM